MKQKSKQPDTQSWNEIVTMLEIRDVTPSQLGKVTGAETHLARKYLSGLIIPNFDTGAKIKSYLDGSKPLTWAAILRRLRTALDRKSITKTELALACDFKRQAINHWLKPNGAMPSWINGIRVHLFLVQIAQQRKTP